MIEPCGQGKEPSIACPPEREAARERAVRVAMRLASPLHRRLYRATGGRVGRRVRGMPILLLTTTGRKTGRPRTWPVVYLEDGDDLVVVASAGGMPTHPAWYLNLRDHPEVTVRLGNRTRTVRAATARPEERARLWARITRQNPLFAGFQAGVEREIPVVILRPEPPRA